MCFMVKLGQLSGLFTTNTKIMLVILVWLVQIICIVHLTGLNILKVVSTIFVILNKIHHCSSDLVDPLKLKKFNARMYSIMCCDEILIT